MNQGEAPKRQVRFPWVLNPSTKPGTNLTLNAPKSTVTVTLDQLGDWTITIGLSSSADKTGVLKELETLGFFPAAESDGVSYLIWTSALREVNDSRGLTETILMDALRALDGPARQSYIG